MTYYSSVGSFTSDFFVLYSLVKMHSSDSRLKTPVPISTRNTTVLPLLLIMDAVINVHLCFCFEFSLALPSSVFSPSRNCHLNAPSECGNVYKNWQNKTTVYTCDCVRVFKVFRFNFSSFFFANRLFPSNFFPLCNNNTC